jgi:hypothetical protein
VSKASVATPKVLDPGKTVEVCDAYRRATGKLCHFRSDNSPDALIQEQIQAGEAIAATPQDAIGIFLEY